MNTLPSSMALSSSSLNEDFWRPCHSTTSVSLSQEMLQYKKLTYTRCRMYQRVHPRRPLAHPWLPFPRRWATVFPPLLPTLPLHHQWEVERSTSPPHRRQRQQRPLYLSVLRCSECRKFCQISWYQPRSLLCRYQASNLDWPTLSC